MRHILQIKLALLGMFLYSSSFTLARVYLDSKNRTGSKPVTVSNTSRVKITLASDETASTYSYPFWAVKE
jgi:hypothetical protein